MFSQDLQAGEIPMGSRSAALGGASVALLDEWSVYNNVASIAKVEHKRVASSIANQYLLPELCQISSLVLFPLSRQAIAFTFYTLGYLYYKERQLGIAYSRLVAKDFSLGVGINGNYIGLPDPYGKRYFGTARIGCSYKLAEHCTVGVQADNITGQLLTFSPRERWRTVLRAGGDYFISERLHLCAEVEKNSYKKALFKAGIEYCPRADVNVRLGMNSASYLFTWGIGMKRAGVSVDLSTSFHPYLGYSLQGAIAYAFKSDEK